MKPQTKHTPGPWMVEKGTLDVIAKKHYDGMEINIRDIETNDRETIQANAALIAAAPDMLEALELVLRQLPTELTLDGEILRDDLKQLVAKARGES